MHKLMHTCLQVSSCQIHRYRLLHHQPVPWLLLPNKTHAVEKKEMFTAYDNQTSVNSKQFSETNLPSYHPELQML